MLENLNFLSIPKCNVTGIEVLSIYDLFLAVCRRRPGCHGDIFNVNVTKC